jgi:plasmid stability protein
MTPMNATLTIPADESLKTALRERAEAQGKTIAETAREILSQVLLEPPLGKRTGHLRGKLELPSERSDAWRNELQARNWRP